MDKKNLREFFQNRRQALSPQRRREAAEAFYLKGIEIARSFPFILSFSPMHEELNLNLLNDFLALKGKLWLPKVSGDQLEIYHVEDLENDVTPSSWEILETIHVRCQKAD